MIYGRPFASKPSLTPTELFGPAGVVYPSQWRLWTSLHLELGGRAAEDMKRESEGPYTDRTSAVEGRAVDAVSLLFLEVISL